jgi:peptidoglycan/LPS O-acetylase OafA/YrhL
MTAGIDYGTTPDQTAATGGRGVRYVPGLDGLRALSLMAILVFHGGFGWAKGGFLGVSVFFTLSGFLVTSVLLADRDRHGLIRIRAFYARRARRLMPAVVALLALVAVLLGLHALGITPGLRGDAIASALWFANWRFVLSGDSYGAVFGSPSPFQHMWSLAVEEQFYLLLPLTMLVLLRRGKASRWPLATFIAAAIAGSTLLCAWLYVPTSTGRAYFGTDTRMAEPLVGVLLALLLMGPGGFRQLPAWARRLLTTVSVAAMAGLVFFVARFGEYDPRLYRGGFLLTALLAAVVIAGVTQRQSIVARALSAPPLVAIGRVSYGAYLYHWPLFLWLTPERTHLDQPTLFGLRCLVTMVVASASYTFLEQPILNGKRLTGKSRGRLALGAWANGTVVALAATVAITQAGTAGVLADDSSSTDMSSAPPLPSVVSAAPAHAAHVGARPSAAARAAQRRAAARVTPGSGIGSASPSAAANAAASEPAPAPVPSASGPVLRVAVVGDSMAMGLGKALITWAQQRSGVVVYNLSGNGCPLAYGGTERFPDGFERDVSDCNWWDDPSSNRTIDMQKFQPDVVVIQDGGNEMVDRKLPSWPAYEGPGDGLFDNWLLGMYRKAFSTFTANSASSARLLQLNAICGNWSQNPHWGNAGNPASRVSSLNFDYSTISSSNYSLHDYNSIVCPNGQFTNTIYGVNKARPDGYHLSPDAALAVVNNWLGPLILANAPPTSSTGSDSTGTGTGGSGQGGNGIGAADQFGATTPAKVRAMTA